MAAGVKRQRGQHRRGFGSSGLHKHDAQEVERLRPRCSALSVTRSEATYALGGDGRGKEPGKIQALSDFMNKEMMYPPLQMLQNKLKRLYVKAYV